ncbi:hypothetical protein LCGC14_1131870 [marine sediment metagenome]|uniref:DSBA-like thioredoxin domain-containing protein n=1 Tax=marine sediment metagenome TaxID=412755 RepID=A0A0F9PJ40_9ZZZZ
MKGLEMDATTEKNNSNSEKKILDKSDEWIIEITQYTDPYCTWCWGSEPIMRKIKAIYGDQVKISFVMGGLVEDFDTFFDSQNNIGGSKKFEQVAAHWEEASRRHGQPVDHQVFFDLKGDFHSTYQASIAYKAAQLLDQELADKYLRRLREATSAERKQIHKIKIQIELAEEVGLDKEKFIQAIESGEAEKKFIEDLKLSRKSGIHGFPTFNVKSRDGAGKFLNGWQHYQAFERVLTDLAGDSLKKDTYNLKESDILRFIDKNKKVSTQEVATLVGIDKFAAYEYLNKLKSVKSIKAGNDYFWVAN